LLDVSQLYHSVEPDSNDYKN